jgi:gamma-glutamyltranspeptidase/glutathione hydrolase
MAHLLAVLLAALTLLPAAASAQFSRSAPEAATGRQEKTLAFAHRHMVAAAHPLAAEAGLTMLRAGGSAVDAAIAAQLVLGLVEPQSSGLGGGAFLLHWTAERRTIDTYDGRETAPAATLPDRFPRGRPFDEIAGTGRSIGVPGVPRLLEAAHHQHGRLPWPHLFEPAIQLAEQGFPVSPRLSQMLASMGPHRFSPAARHIYFDADGRPWQAGHLLRNPAYARTLGLLARQGAQAFYSGEIATSIVTAARSTADLPSDMTLDDLAAYRVERRPPICFTYRGYSICSMGPPSSGGIALAQIMGLLAPSDLGSIRDGMLPADGLHLIAEAEKLAYADRDHYLADPATVPIPHGLLDPTYLAARRQLISPERAMPKPPAGNPPGAERRALGKDTTREIAGTSHISVVDGLGNAVAMTSTIEAAFGSRIWAAGFLLNNQLTDFAMQPVDSDGRPAANAPGPGKRPRSSMSPAFVLDGDGRLSDVLGSPGGSRIILYVAKALIALIDWRLDPQAAAALPNFGSRGSYLEIEHQAALATDLAKLRALGHEVRLEEMTSGLQIVSIRQGRLLGGADPRREGVAIGD